MRLLLNRDAHIGFAIFILGIALYAPFALRVAAGRYYEFANLAFDFDPNQIFALLTSPASNAMGFKHPLMLLARPLGLAMMETGLPAKEAAAMVMVVMGAATLTLVWFFLRAVKIPRPESAALALLFALSSTQLFVSLITETYAFAGFSIVLVWFVAATRIVQPLSFQWLRYGAALMALGVTITNVTQAFVAELVVTWRWHNFRRAVIGIVLTGAIISAIAGILAVFIWHDELLRQAKDPILALKHIWWMQPKGDKTGMGAVLQTFFGYSFVAPNWSFLRLPESTNMRDFRDWSFPLAGQFAIALWLIFVATGTVAAFMSKSYRPLAMAMAGMLVFNLLFHLVYQFRGSLFLYAAHSHFLIFALGAGLAAVLGERRTVRAAYISVVLILSGLFALNNLPRAHEFSEAFDVPDTNCPAPCFLPTP